MKLTDINPSWYAQSGRHGQGVSFDCPHCHSLGLQPPYTPTRITIPFDRPLDGGTPVSMRPDGQIVAWARTGDTFDTLTLSPSIDFHHGNGRWHGYIRNGEATPC